MNPALEALYVIDPDRDWPTYMAAMRVKCPWCRVRPYQHCHTNGVPLREGNRIHPSRESKGHEEAEQ